MPQRKKKRVPSKRRSPKPSIAKAGANPAWEPIYVAVGRIPVGRVATYGGIAHVAGLPRRARLVGTALKSLPRGRRLPWHRVLTASGKLAFPVGSDAYAKQTSLLKKEGVSLRGGRVDLARHLWPSAERGLDELLWKVGD